MAIQEGPVYPNEPEVHAVIKPPDKALNMFFYNAFNFDNKSLFLLKYFYNVILARTDIFYSLSHSNSLFGYSSCKLTPDSRHTE